MQRRTSCHGQRLRGRLLGVAVALLASSTTIQADHPAPTDQVTGSQTINAEQFVELVLQNPQMRIIDSRIGTDRQHGYIEGSISLPDVDTDCRSLAKVLPSTDTPVAFYCNGPKCGRSGRAAHIAIHCGYTQSYWFRGGFEEWTAKGFPTLLE